MLGLIAITSSVLAVVIAVFVSVQCDLGASTPLQDDCLIIILRNGPAPVQNRNGSEQLCPSTLHYNVHY